MVRRRSAVAVVVAVTAILAATTGTGSAAPKSTSTAQKTSRATVAQPTLAHLRTTVWVTSDWAKVRVVPTRLAAHRVVTNANGATVRAEDDGWVVTNRAPGALAIVTIDTWFAETAGVENVAFRLLKGASHAASISVQNVSGPTAEPVLDLVNRVTTPDASGMYVTRATVDRTQAYGTVQPTLPRPETTRRVLAFYYPWYEGGRYTDPLLADRPSQPRATAKYEGVLSMTRQASAAGVTGFIVSWMGDAKDGLELDHVVRAAEATGGSATVVLEAEVANAAVSPSSPTDPAVVRRWLTQALARSTSPAFVREGGVPVVFVWQMQRLPAAAWKAILDELAAAGTPVRLVGDGAEVVYGGVTWGSYQYGVLQDLPQLRQDTQQAALAVRARAAAGATGPRLWAGTVSPGYNERKLDRPAPRFVPRGAKGERYLGTWDAAELADPDWVLVTSWNEWYESTSIEPSKAYGDLALRQTDQRATAWRAGR